MTLSLLIVPRMPAPTVAQPTIATLRPRRSPRLVAAGVLLAALGGLGGVMAYQQASHSNQVVVVAHSVPRGEVVQSTDLSVVTIGPAPGVRTIPGDQLTELVGKQALVDLPAGSLVGTGAIGTATLEAGQVQLGLKLQAGRVPVQSLPAGTAVQLVQVSSDKQHTKGLVVDAVVVTAPRTSTDGSSSLLDVAVPEGVSAEVADLAARDLIVLVRKAS